MTVRYAIASTRLGPILLAATERGVSRLAFGRHTDLVRAILLAHGGNTARRDDGALAPFVGVVRRYLDGEVPALDLPVDVVGTPFEERVWAALRAIPLGETRSYGAVARALDEAATAQEVARACAANPIALVVPCHRVVRSDGTLGGYRWGVWRKRALLALEARAAAPKGTPDAGVARGVAMERAASGAAKEGSGCGRFGLG
ncbi:MAG: methylated-DNA--[protein]-cysteine S-methyltransferase [Chloroflexota bacterium]|nr:methylated-DNA--[protein]-cysteine S-methyltransferase [Chloroflexota bacterium]